MFKLRAIVLLVLVCFRGEAFAVQKKAVERPRPMLLHSSYTAWTSDNQLNVSAVPLLARQAAKMGVNTVFVCGSMAGFDTMSVDERLELAEAWLEIGPAYDLYIIVNVGTTVVSEAKLLAEHAALHGAAAIATVPPYYTRTTDLTILVNWLREVASGAPDLPLFYYHLPGVTGVDIAVADLLQASEDAGFDQLSKNGGVKYVGSDNQDFLNCANWVAADLGKRGGVSVLYAPEPKLQGFPLQTPYAGAVLAEDFYAPTLLRMRAAYDAGNAPGMIAEQNWKQGQAEPVFSTYGGACAKRKVYLKFCGADLGPDRSPNPRFDESKYDDLVADLDAIGFWDQAPPECAPLPG